MHNSSFKNHKLAALRASRKLDQDQLARATGLSRPTIQRLESGVTRYPWLPTLQVLAEFFGVPINIFFTDEVLEIR